MRIGIFELILILIVALLALGPEKMPIYAKKVGKALNSLKDYTKKITEEINENIVDPLEEVKKPLKDISDPFTSISKTIHKPMDEINNSINNIGKNKVTCSDEISTEEISVDSQVNTIDDNQKCKDSSV